MAHVFICFFSPAPQSALCKLGQPGGLFASPQVLIPVLEPFFIFFLRAFPLFVFQPLLFWIPFSYSNYLTIFQYSLPGKSHGRRSLAGWCLWDRQESDMTERLHFHFHFSLSCIGERNGNPLRYSCLENPMGGGAWWAAIYGVAQSRTRLK